ncbi:MAG: ATP-dependent DNA ligase [archaeon]|nr:ATP-dependent DNA ligase [archaeon]
MLFSQVTAFFDEIESVSSRLEMTVIVAKMLSKPPEKEIPQVVYLSQGLLGPSYATKEIGLGENLLMESISKATGFTRKEIEKRFLEKGDLGIVVCEIIAKKKQTSLFSESLSLEKVFSNLEKIRVASGKGSQEQKLRLLAELFNSANPSEGKFIARIVLGSMRLGIGDPTIMDALALNYSKEFVEKNRKRAKEIEENLKEKKEEARKEEFDRRIKQKVRHLIEEKYNIFPDLGKIAQTLKKEGLLGLKKIKITPGIPIRPTLAERLPSAEEIVEKLGKCIVEAKFDGFRLQVHKTGEQVKIFSRQSENITGMFPEIVEAVKKTVKAKSAIFEGEALAFNEKTGEFYPFQVTVQRKRKYDIKEKAGELPLKLFVFDALTIDNESLLDKPFSERRRALEKLVPKEGVISPTPSIFTDDPKEIDGFFKKNIEAGLEGIIAKDPNARYIAGARKFAWIKLKRSYKGELNDSVDVVVIGYFKGKGKRTQFGLGGLLTAVYNEEKDSFESITKIGTGMSEKQMGELEQILSKLEVKKKPARVESVIEPDEWVEPKLVIEVRADEITKSPTHMAGKDGQEGFALRFPRMISVRTDKKPEQATSTKEIIKMFKMQKHVSVGGSEA